jgi:hypothetical protein
MYENKSDQNFIGQKYFYLDIVGSAWNTLWHCSDSSGGSERFFDDERDTAADTVLGDHSGANVIKLFTAARSKKVTAFAPVKPFQLSLF